MQHVGGPRQLRRADPASLGLHPVDLVGREGVEEAALDRVGHRIDQNEVAQPLQQVRGEAARVVPRPHDLVDHGEQRRPVAGGERVDGLVEQHPVGHPEQRDRPLVAQSLGTGARQQLIEHRQRVAHRAGASADHQREHRRVDLGAFLGAYRGQMIAQHPRRHQPEGVVMRPGPDGGDHLVRLGRREDELQVGWRLLDDLEQRVERRGGHHVRLVHHEDLEPGRGRREERAFPQVTSVVHEAVRGGVDLGDVHRRAGPDGHALVAHATRFRRRPLLAVERGGEDPRRRGLPAAARAAEQIGMVQPAGPQRLHQRRRHMLLPDDLAEHRGPVPVVQRCAHSVSSSLPGFLPD